MIEPSLPRALRSLRSGLGVRQLRVESQIRFYVALARELGVCGIGHPAGGVDDQGAPVEKGAKVLVIADVVEGIDELEAFVVPLLCG